MRAPNENSQPGQLKDFDYRIIVSGTRAFNDAKLFEENLKLYLEHLDIAGEEHKSRVCFLLGQFKAGIEPLLIDWCERNGYAYFTFTPNWSDIDAEGAVVRERNGRKYNAVALLWTNEEMAELGSHLITFYDGVSTDTQDLVTRVSERFNPTCAVLVHFERDEGNNHARQAYGS